MTILATLLGTFAGVGYLKPAPGTWGSLAALPVAWAFHQLGGFPMLIVATAAFFILGVWATTIMTEHGGEHDPSEIVMDEVVGQFIAIMPLSYPAWRMDLDILTLWPGWIAAFFFFRLFDILKPGPVGKADRRKDPVGVMLDDVIAGAMAALCVLVLGVLYHVVLFS